MPQYQIFDAEDKIVETTKVTTGYFSDGGGILEGSDMVTQSLTASQAQYYANIRKSGTTTDEFSITFGNRPGLGSSDVTGHTKGIYQYYADLLLFPDEIEDVGFQFVSGSTEDNIFVIAAERARMKDRFNRKNWTLVLSGSNGAGAGAKLELTDDSAYTAATPTPVGNRYNIISGTAGTGFNGGGTGSFYAAGHPYGYVYPNLGLLVMDGTALAAQIPGVAVESGSSVAANADGVGFQMDSASSAANHLKLFHTLKSGSFTARSEEDQITTSYFVRARAAHWNFSNNPTFYSASNGTDATFSVSEFTGNPQTFITTIGLHDAQGTCVAVGRLSTPVLKNFSTEFTAKVNLVH